jgi:hypothetical protein
LNQAVSSAKTDQSVHTQLNTHLFNRCFNMMETEPPAAYGARDGKAADNDAGGVGVRAFGAGRRVRLVKLAGRGDLRVT